MSHIVSIKTQIRDPIALAAACVRMGLEQPVQGRARLFSAEAEGWIVQLPGWVYPAVIDTAAGHVAYDNFNGAWGEQKELDRLLCQRRRDNRRNQPVWRCACQGAGSLSAVDRVTPPVLRQSWFLSAGGSSSARRSKGRRLWSGILEEDLAEDRRFSNRPIAPTFRSTLTLLQSYAVEKAKIEARRQGHSVAEQALSDGAPRLETGTIIRSFTTE